MDEEINLTIARGILPGDPDEDGSVGFDDLLTLAQHYGQTSGAAWQDGDFNSDGAVNFDDLLLLVQNYGATPSADQFTQLGLAVPEPAAWMVISLAALASRRRLGRHQRRALTR